MATGRDIKAAFKKGAAWHTAVVAGVGDGLFILSEAVPAKLPQFFRNDEAGRPFPLNYDQGNVDIAGTFEAWLRYLGLDVVIALTMGSAGSPIQPDPGVHPTVYQNSYKLADTLSGLFGTLVIDKKVSIWEYPSVKLHGFELTGEAGQPLRIRLDAVADNLLRSGNETTTNTAGTMNSVTFPTTGLRVMFSQGRFRINDQNSPALVDSDKIYPSSFSLRYRRPVAGDHVADLTRFITEPVEDGLPEISLEVRFDEYSGDARLNDIVNDVAKKADILFQGAAISGSYLYQFKLSFPHLVASDARAAVTGPGKILHVVTYQALATETAPSGMAGILKPFQVDVQNTRSTDPLA